MSICHLMKVSISVFVHIFSGSVGVAVLLQNMLLVLFRNLYSISAKVGDMLPSFMVI